MAITRNKLVPIIGIAAMVIIGAILMAKLRGGGTTPAKPTASQVKGLPSAKGADQDTPAETLATVVTSNKELRNEVQQVIDQNKKLQAQLALRPAPAATANRAIPNPAPGTGNSSDISRGGITDAFGNAIDQASGVIDTLSSPRGALSGTRPPGSGVQQAPAGNPAGRLPVNANSSGLDGQSAGGDAYTVLPPMGYAEVTVGGKGRPQTVSYVRPSASAAVGIAGDAAATARAAALAADSKKPVPYFTIPENATLVGSTAMTSIIGRVPVDNRITDPFQFKAVVGHDNLAANGFELPDDIAGMIVSGIAIGDMTLSCSEGRIRSVTFVFNDGSIRTVSSGNMTASVQTDQGASNDLGFISDMHGNPCIQGKFVTNAPAYLTDIAAMKTLTAAGQAYAAAQTAVTQSATTGTNSAVTGNMGAYALGQAISAGSDEVSKWMLDRLKSSFDAVVTPAGQQLVLHLNKEIDIDKNPQGRKLVHRSQEPLLNTGERYGLE